MTERLFTSVQFAKERCVAERLFAADTPEQRERWAAFGPTSENCAKAKAIDVVFGEVDR